MSWIKPYFLIFAAAIVGLVIGLDQPRGFIFDEFHYVPAARKMIAMDGNPNWEHPPLAKELVAMGILTFGDQPWGWRLLSVLFGALTLVAVFGIGRAVFKNDRDAWVLTTITAFNQMWFVLSRVAMLEPFAFGFLAWAIWAILKRRYKVGGLLFGLAICCKWSVLVLWGIVLGGLFVFEAVRESLQAKAATKGFKKAKSSPKKYDFFSGIKKSAEFFLFTGLAYFIPFLFFRSLDQYRSQSIEQFISSFLTMNAEMWDGQQRVVTPHPYNSQWWQWPTLIRPMWFAFEKEGANQEWVRGVMMIGNPLVLWPGLVAWLWTLVRGVQKRSALYLAIAASYFLTIASWWIIPRKIAFFYYYYPSALILGFALTAWLAQVPTKIRYAYLSIIILVFLYFYPILAGLKIPTDTFRNWMWRSSWI